MPAETLQEFSKLATSYAIVGGVAVPVAVASWLASRKLGRPLFPRQSPGRSRWNGFEVLFLFFFNIVLLSLLVVGLQQAGFYRAVYGPEFPDPIATSDAVGAVAGAAAESVLAEEAASFQTVRAVWAGLFAVPVLAGIVLALRAGKGAWPGVDPAGIPGRIAVGVVAWAVFTPLVFAVYGLTDLVISAIGGEIERHPMTRLGVGESTFDQLLFAASVCVAAPLTEEILFRGILVRWACGRGYRPWLVMVGAVGLAILGSGEIRSPAVAFAVLLPVGLGGVILVGKPAMSRGFALRAGGIWASAALFAMAHSAVWPTPVPLFFLGLGLGFLALRTRGILACVVAHGLFNAVSFVYLLRGGTG